jgi:hypothetical protein
MYRNAIQRDPKEEWSGEIEEAHHRVSDWPGDKKENNYEEGFSPHSERQ